MLRNRHKLLKLREMSVNREGRLKINLLSPFFTLSCAPAESANGLSKFGLPLSPATLSLCSPEPRYSHGQRFVAVVLNLNLIECINLTAESLDPFGKRVVEFGDR